MEATMANQNQRHPGQADQGKDKTNRMNDPVGENKRRQRDQETDQERNIQQGGDAGQNPQRRETGRGNQQR
jgi:hypothetical protein